MFQNMFRIVVEKGENTDNLPPLQVIEASAGKRKIGSKTLSLQENQRTLPTEIPRAICGD